MHSEVFTHQPSSHNLCPNASPVTPVTPGIAVATFGALILVQLIRYGGVDSPSYLIGYHLSGALGPVRDPERGPGVWDSLAVSGQAESGACPLTSLATT